MSNKRTVEVALHDPGRALRAVRFHVRNLWVKGVGRNPNTTTFARDSRPGPTASLFASIARVPGWFTYDDCAHFCLVLNTQFAAGARGDILEIGSYHGRSTIVLADCLQPGETLVVCDPFQRGEVYVGNPPTPGTSAETYSAHSPTSTWSGWRSTRSTPRTWSSRPTHGSGSSTSTAATRSGT